MTLPQIKQLSAGSGSASVSESVSKPTPPSLDFEAPAAPASSEVGTRPVLPPEIPEYFRRPRNPTAELVYRASVIGVSKLHFVDAKAALDLWVTYGHLAPVGDDGFAVWEESEQVMDPKSQLDA